MKPKEHSVTRSRHSQKLAVAALAILAASCSSNSAQNSGSGGSSPSMGGASGGATTTSSGGQVGTGRLGERRLGQRGRNFGRWRFKLRSLRRLEHDDGRWQLW